MKTNNLLKQLGELSTLDLGTRARMAVLEEYERIIQNELTDLRERLKL